MKTLFDINESHSSQGEKMGSYDAILSALTTKYSSTNGMNVTPSGNLSALEIDSICEAVPDFNQSEWSSASYHLSESTAASLLSTSVVSLYEPAQGNVSDSALMFNHNG